MMGTKTVLYRKLSCVSLIPYFSCMTLVILTKRALAFAPAVLMLWRKVKFKSSVIPRYYGRGMNCIGWLFSLMAGGLPWSFSLSFFLPLVLLIEIVIRESVAHLVRISHIVPPVCRLLSTCQFRPAKRLYPLVLRESTKISPSWHLHVYTPGAGSWVFPFMSREKRTLTVVTHLARVHIKGLLLLSH